MRKYKMVTKWYIRVNGRVFEVTEKETRRDELVEILPGFYPGAVIETEAKRERRYL